MQLKVETKMMFEVSKLILFLRLIFFSQILKSIAQIFADLSKCADGFVLMPGQEVAGDHQLGAYTGLSTNHCADICNLIQVNKYVTLKLLY